MLAWGIILCLAGAGSTGYGFWLNNDLGSQLDALFDNGHTNPGTPWIVAGITAAVIGLLLIVLYALKQQNGESVTSKAKEDEYVKICPQCGKANSEEAKFCRYCAYDFTVKKSEPAEKSEGKICPQCGKANSEEARFCRYCGYDFAVKKAEPAEKPAGKICPHCGKSVSEEAKFCGYCGYDFSAVKKSAPDGFSVPTDLG